MSNKESGWNSAQSIFHALRYREQRQTVRQLLHMREPMSPATLGVALPGYAYFRQQGPYVWINDFVDTPLSRLGGANKITVALIGPSASGKDAIMAQMEQTAANNIVTIQTATDRERRNEGDINYIFMKPDEMQDMLESEQLIEALCQGGHTYGTPIQSVEQALSGPEKIALWRGDLSGLSTFQQWINRIHPEVPFLSVFVIPGRTPASYFKTMIKERGVVDSVRWRIPKALWELESAPNLAHVALVNPFEKTGSPQQAGQALCELLRVCSNPI